MQFPRSSAEGARNLGKPRGAAVKGCKDFFHTDFQRANRPTIRGNHLRSRTQRKQTSGVLHAAPSACRRSSEALARAPQLDDREVARRREGRRSGQRSSHGEPRQRTGAARGHRLHTRALCHMLICYHQRCCNACNFAPDEQRRQLHFITKGRHLTG